MTTYIVFELDGADSWHEVWRVDARSTSEALRRFLNEPPQEQEVTLVAVSARSWQPRKVTTKLRITFEPERVPARAVAPILDPDEPF